MSAAYAVAAGQDPFKSAREQAEAMEKHLRSSESMESTHAELEGFVVDEGREHQRRLLQAHLELRAAAAASTQAAPSEMSKTPSFQKSRTQMTLRVPIRLQICLRNDTT